MRPAGTRRGWSAGRDRIDRHSSIDVEIGIAKRSSKRGAIFFLGVYGGPASEGLSDRDTNEPRRFFSYFTDGEIQIRLQQTFHLISFDRTELSRPGGHFQAITLQKA